MKRFSIYHIPVLSFFSRALYRDVGTNWKGICFGYLLLLLMVCWIPPMISLYTGFSNFQKNEAPGILSQIPGITITNGELSIDQPEPHYIRDPETDQALIAFDTTGSITSLEDVEGLVGLVTKTEATFMKSEVETRTFDFSGIQNFTFDERKATSWLNLTKNLTVPVLYPLAVLGSYVFRILQLLIYAAIGLLIALMCKTKLSYGALLRLGAVAITPGIIVKTILKLAGVSVPWSGLWFFLAAMGFLVFGVLSTKGASGGEAASGPSDLPGGAI